MTELEWQTRKQLIEPHSKARESRVVTPPPGPVGLICRLRLGLADPAKGGTRADDSLSPTGGEGQGEGASCVSAGPYPDYVCRVTSDEGDIGRGPKQWFQDVETRIPVILATSQLLTTGHDEPPAATSCSCASSARW